MNMEEKTPRSDQLFQELRNRIRNAASENTTSATTDSHPLHNRQSLHEELRSRAEQSIGIAMSSERYQRTRVGLGGRTNRLESKSFSQRCSSLERMLQKQQEKYGNIDGSPQSITDPALYDQISQQAWSKCLLLLRSNPELARYQHHRGGLLPLHRACSRGSTPHSIIEALVEAYPPAVNFQTPSNLCDTPLHMQSRNSQRTCSKIKTMLLFANAEITNRLGHTALHTACGSIAMIEVLQALIDQDESLLEVKDIYGQTPLIALWESFLQSIPGHLTVARILKDGDDAPLTQSFLRFWDKVRLLVLRSCTDYPSDLLGHAMLQVGAPTKMIQVAMKMDSELATRIDEDGNTLLHKMIQCRRAFEKNLFRSAASARLSLMRRNRNGDTILTLAIQGTGMVDYIPIISHACPELISEQDLQTQLYPFQQAAAENCSLDVIYSLLLEQPQVIQY